MMIAESLIAEQKEIWKKLRRLLSGVVLADFDPSSKPAHHEPIVSAVEKQLAPAQRTELVTLCKAADLTDLDITIFVAALHTERRHQRQIDAPKSGRSMSAIESEIAAAHAAVDAAVEKRNRNVARLNYELAEAAARVSTGETCQRYLASLRQALPDFFDVPDNERQVHRLSEVYGCPAVDALLRLKRQAARSA